MPKKQYKLEIEPITGVHIGTGNELTPLDYKLITTKNATTGLIKKMYIKYSSDKILKRLIENRNEQKLSEFDRVSAVGNMKSLQRFFQDGCSDLDDIEYPCEVTEEFIKLYNRNAEKDPYDKDNAAKVNQMYRTEGKKTPVIPGSSIKGAIRTAVLNKILYDLDDEKYNNLVNDFKKNRDPRDRARFEPRIQKELLNGYKDAKQDPFRSIEITDCSFSFKNSQIVGVLKNISFNKNRSSVKAMQICAEVIKGILMDDLYEKGIAVIRINQAIQDIPDGVKKKLSIDDIVSSCNEFYLTQFKKEYDSFYRDADDSEYDSIIKLYKQLKEIAENGKVHGNEFIIRVGRWSQVEYVTFGSDFRSPKTSKNKWGGTRTVFNYDDQYLPLGWCKCTVSEIKE